MHAFDLDAVTLTVLELADDRYVERAVLQPDGELQVSLPFSMTVSATALLY